MDTYYNCFDVVKSNIKKYRRKANMTQSELAIKTNLSHEHIRRIESKNCNSTSIETLFVISKALRIPFYYLFKEN